MGGCAASLVCHPLDILRTRLVAQGEPKVKTMFVNKYVPEKITNPLLMNSQLSLIILTKYLSL